MMDLIQESASRTAQALVHILQVVPAFAASTQHFCSQALPALAAVAQQFSVAQQAGLPADDVLWQANMENDNATNASDAARRVTIFIVRSLLGGETAPEQPSIDAIYQMQSTIHQNEANASLDFPRVANR